MVDLNSLDEVSSFLASIKSNMIISDVVKMSDGNIYAIKDEDFIMGTIIFKKLSESVVEMILFASPDLDKQKMDIVRMHDIIKDRNVIMMVNEGSIVAEEIKQFGFCECGRISSCSSFPNLILLQRAPDGKRLMILD